MSSEGVCKIAYAADGTMICDPKTKPNVQGSYIAKPTCPDAKCTVFGKSCVAKFDLKDKK